MKRGLGKGLEALLAIYDSETPEQPKPQPRPDVVKVQPKPFELTQIYQKVLFYKHL